MIDFLSVEESAESYVNFWNKTRSNINSIYEDSNFGYEHFQILRTVNIEDLSFYELSRLIPILTFTLRGQINNDHKLLWAWCADVCNRIYPPSLTIDAGWIYSYNILINLCLGKITSSGDYSGINRHFYYAGTDGKWLLSGLLSCSVLEGLLRRKCLKFVDNEGNIIKSFDLSKYNGRKYPKGRLNQIGDGLRLFEYLNSIERGRVCLFLNKMKKEIENRFGVTDAYEEINQWRNSLLHGGEYWISRGPYLLNLISLLVIDEIGSELYETKLEEIVESLSIWKRRGIVLDSSWNFYPPAI